MTFLIVIGSRYRRDPRPGGVVRPPGPAARVAGRRVSGRSPRQSRRSRGDELGAIRPPRWQRL